MTANEKQVAGNHYKTSIEHWDYVVANDLNYLEGQITKYVTRCRKKNGMQDLEKAKHFLEKYMEVFKEVHGHPAVVKHGYYGEKGPPPAQAGRCGITTLSNPTLADFEALHPSYLHNEHFTCEGGSGRGYNIYNCKVCRAEILATGLEDAAVQHGVPCTRPRAQRAR